MAKKIRVTVWNEFLHEKEDERVKRVYPDGIHQAIATGLGKCKDMEVRTATLDEPEHGLTQEVLDNTDVLMWWGHMAHHLVADEVVSRVRTRVLSGMGLAILTTPKGVMTNLESKKQNVGGEVLCYVW